MDITWDITLHLPDDITFLRTMSFVLVFSAAVLITCLLARFTLGKDSSLKHAICSALAILMLYAMCVVVYTFSPKDFTHYLNRLPLGGFMELDDGQKVFVLNTLRGLNAPQMCYQLLRIFMLSLMINMLGSFTPDKLKGLGWLVYRVFTLVCAIGINYVLYKLIDALVPFVLKSYWPMIILSILAFSFSMGFLKFLLAMLMTEVNPVFGSFYTFFFTNKFGKNFSRAVGTTIVVALFMVVMEHLGYGILRVSPADLKAYVPFTLSMFFLWIIVGRSL